MGNYIFESTEGTLCFRICEEIFLYKIVDLGLDIFQNIVDVEKGQGGPC